MRFHRRQQRIEAARRQSADLFKSARRNHLIKTGIDPRIKRGALRREEQFDRTRGIKDRRRLVPMPVGERPAGRLDHFERAGDTGAVARTESDSGFGIAARELRMQRFGALHGECLPHAVADSVRIGGTAASP